MFWKVKTAVEVQKVEKIGTQVGYLKNIIPGITIVKLVGEHPREGWVVNGKPVAAGGEDDTSTAPRGRAEGQLIGDAAKRGLMAQVPGARAVFVHSTEPCQDEVPRLYTVNVTVCDHRTNAEYVIETEIVASNEAEATQGARDAVASENPASDVVGSRIATIADLTAESPEPAVKAELEAVETPKRKPGRPARKAA